MKLHYIDLYGKGESIRMLLAHAKVEYEDVRFPKSDIARMNEAGELEFGQVPVLDLPEGERLVQSMSILRYLGKLNGYYPEDSKQAYMVDSTLDSLEDVFAKFYASLGAATEEAQAKIWDQNYSCVFPEWARAMEKRLKENESSSYIVGDKMTAADFHMASLAYAYIFNDQNPHAPRLMEIVEAEAPTLKGYFERLGSEELAEYLKSRSPRTL